MASKTQLRPISIEDVQLIFKNFSGNPDKFNAEGNRNFGILVDKESAVAMEADGWAIKYLKPRPDEDEDPDLQAWLKVKLNMKSGQPPRVVMITSKGKTTMTEDMVGALDYVIMKKVDISISPWAWSMGGNEGISAYVKTLYVTIEEDFLDLKYADVPELDSSGNLLAIEAGSDGFDDLGEYHEQLAIED